MTSDNVEWLAGRQKADGTEIHGIETEAWATMGWKARFEVVNDTLEEVQEQLAAVEKDRDRLKKWVMRTASDDNLEHRAGYHGKRVRREAMAVMCGKTIPVVKE